MKLARMTIKICGAVFVLIFTFAISAWGKGSIEGVVVDSYGQSIEGATIELKGAALSQAGIRTASDANGQYQIKDLDGGSYELTITSRGFRREIVSVQLFADEVKHRIIGLEVGRVTDAVPIYISGVIQFEGKPLSHTIVTVTNAFNERNSTTAKTDKQGRYKLKIFDGGQYIITAFCPGFEASVETRRFDSFPINKPRIYQANMSLVRFRGL